jgi:hypothetical protein
VDASPAGNSALSSSCAYNVLVLGETTVQISWISAAQAQLSWTAVPGATSYAVYSAPALDGSWSLEGSSATTSLIVPIGGDETRIFQVRAVH